MNKKIIGAVLIILLMVGAAFVLRVLFVGEKEEEVAAEKAAEEAEAQEKIEFSNSNSIKGTITVAIDSWVGYFPLKSKEFKKKMRNAGWVVKAEDDAGDYATRMKRLNDGDIDFAVVTVDSYLLNAATYDYPGVIVAVIDESKGGDAVVARVSKGKTLDDYRGKTVKVGFTPSSPSHHLLKVLKKHFNLPELLPAKGSEYRVETDGSGDAFQKLMSDEIDVAVLWEPDVSRALAEKGFVKLFGTEKTERYIVDILVVNREFMIDHQATVKLFLSNYFKALKYYRDHPNELISELKLDSPKLTETQIKDMIKGVSWQSLSANCTRWFGINRPEQKKLSDEILIEVIDSTIDVLIANGDFKRNPLPSEDPYRICYSNFLEELFQSYVGATNGEVDESNVQVEFEKLPLERWNELQEFGTLRVEPIIFQQGTSRLSFEGKEVLNQTVENLKYYPNFRLKVAGHTSDRGDPDMNKQLSQERADAVLRYLNVTHGVAKNRCLAIGYGGEKPLTRLPGENMRSWRYRLPRVELILVQEDL